jgi:hypothetical protein
MGSICLFMTICYALMAYGACNILAFSEGPFNIFTRIREFAFNISENFGKVFTCMMCLPANFGWICSIVNWFLIPIPFTPFNIIFYGESDLWFLALLCDGAFTTGVVYILYLINEYIEKKINYYEYNSLTEDDIEGYDKAENEDKILLVEDITLNNKDNE